MKETPKLTVNGKYPEIELKDIHFCCIEECPREDITLFFGLDITVPKSKLGDTIQSILKMKETLALEDLEEGEWQITLERSKHKQAKLP
jgi:hypothetical protein